MKFPSRIMSLLYNFHKIAHGYDSHDCHFKQLLFITKFAFSLGLECSNLDLSLILYYNIFRRRP